MKKTFQKVTHLSGRILVLLSFTLLFFIAAGALAAPITVPPTALLPPDYILQARPIFEKASANGLIPIELRVTYTGKSQVRLLPLERKYLTPAWENLTYDAPPSWVRRPKEPLAPLWSGDKKIVLRKGDTMRGVVYLKDHFSRVVAGQYELPVTLRIWPEVGQSQTPIILTANVRFLIEDNFEEPAFKGSMASVEYAAGHDPLEELDTLKSKIKLSLSAEKLTYSLNEPISISAEIVNDAGTELSYLDQDNDGGLELFVRDSEGVTAPILNLSRFDPDYIPKKVDTIKIATGKTKITNIIVSSLFDLSSKKTYIVSANLFVQITTSTGAKSYIPVISNRIEVSVK